MISFDYPPGATPLTQEDMEGLRLTHITTRGELDRWEQENILGKTRFTWGGAGLNHTGDCRARYIAALHAADGHDFEPLLDFVRS